MTSCSDTKLDSTHTTVTVQTNPISTSIPLPTVTVPTPTDITFSSPDWFSYSWLAFANWKYSPGIYIIQADGAEWKQLTTDLGLYDNPAWSPDGHVIAFDYVSQPTDDKTQIYLVNIDGTGLVKITSDEKDNRDPSWSPDGNDIVYVGQARGDTIQSKLYITDKAGRSMRQLTDEKSNSFSPEWSPDGKSIAFLSTNVEKELTYLKIINVDGTNERTAVKLPLFYGFGGISWSPDASYLAFNATEICDKYAEGVANGWEIFITDIRNGTTQRLTNNPDWYPLELAWSPVPALLVDKTYLVITGGGFIDLHNMPSSASLVVGQLYEEEKFLVLEGPVDADGYYWWRVRAQDGVEGWLIEMAGWYTLVK
jgi:Tol biopolymer transport system component